MVFSVPAESMADATSFSPAFSPANWLGRLAASIGFLWLDSPARIASDLAIAPVVVAGGCQVSRRANAISRYWAGQIPVQVRCSGYGTSWPDTLECSLSRWCGRTRSRSVAGSRGRRPLACKIRARYLSRLNQHCRPGNRFRCSEWKERGAKLASVALAVFSTCPFVAGSNVALGRLACRTAAKPRAPVPVGSISPFNKDKNPARCCADSTESGRVCPSGWVIGGATSIPATFTP